MFVVTFYSFKGGVGRTMALVNVGAYLASSGRRVLLVDFDLEAPSLPTYDLARPPNIQHPGVVEFVTKFLDTSEDTDIAGICTRQLPDAVCAIFMPNKQNLDGLLKITKKVREQSSIPDLRNPKLMFVASNVPDLDDEDGELAKIMQEYRERLGYEH